MTNERAPCLLLDETTPSAATLDRPFARRRLSLRLNFSWMFAGNVVYAVCQWGMLSVLAKLGTPAMVGQFVLALAVTAPIMAFFRLQLRAVQATDAKREYQFGDYLALRLITIALALVAIGGTCLAFGYRSETALIIIAAGISAGIESLSDIVYGLLQKHERMDRIAESMMVKGIVSLVAMATAILLTNRVLFAVVAIAAARLIVLVARDLPNAWGVLHGDSHGVLPHIRSHGRLLPSWDANKVFALARLALPLGLVMMLIALGSSIPRYFVGHYLGEHALGMFGAIAYLGLVGTTAVGALGQAASPRLAQYFAQGRKGPYCILLFKLAAVGATIGLAGIVMVLLIGPQVLSVVYGPEYAAHHEVLQVAMIAVAIGYVASLGGYGITAARCFRIQIPIFAVVAAATAMACLWLVPGAGLMGAAWSLCVGAATQLLGVGLVIWHATTKPAGIRTDSTRLATVGNS